MSDAIAIIGAGPAGLMAADHLSAAGHAVTIYERMPSPARKFLLAGRGGLNLTHSEPLRAFLRRYGAAGVRLAPMLEAFSSEHLVAWARGLGQETFVGSSGRVFPRAMKASPLLRAWLARLSERGVLLRTRMTWTGWSENGALRFAGADAGVTSVEARATVLALGGASWPKLGSDGAWAPLLRARGIDVAPFKPANVGFEAAWSAPFKERFAGAPLKSIVLRYRAQEAAGEVMITEYGLEGGALYALSAPIREALALGAPVRLEIDLRPALAHQEIEARLARARRGDSFASVLRKALGLDPAAINLLRESGAPPREPRALAMLIKAAPVMLQAPRGLERAISSAGGISWAALGEDLQLKAMPGVYAIGEMLDWEAPTGGYLLQACFASGAWAAHALLKR